MKYIFLEHCGKKDCSEKIHMEENMKKSKRKAVSRVIKRTCDRAISVLDKARKGLISMNPDRREVIVL